MLPHSPEKHSDFQEALKQSLTLAGQYIARKHGEHPQRTAVYVELEAEISTKLTPYSQYGWDRSQVSQAVRAGFHAERANQGWAQYEV